MQKGLFHPLIFSYKYEDGGIISSIYFFHEVTSLNFSKKLCSSLSCTQSSYFLLGGGALIFSIISQVIVYSVEYNMTGQTDPNQ